MENKKIKNLKLEFINESFDILNGQLIQNEDVELYNKFLIETIDNYKVEFVLDSVLYFYEKRLICHILVYEDNLKLNKLFARFNVKLLEKLIRKNKIEKLLIFEII